MRNFVALPAGTAEVPVVRFGLLTFAGSLIWDSAMALIGYGLGTRWKSVMHGFSDAGYLLGAVALVAVAVFLVHRYRSYKAATASLDDVEGNPPRHSQRVSTGPAEPNPERAGGPQSKSTEEPPNDPKSFVPVVTFLACSSSAQVFLRRDLGDGSGTGVNPRRQPSARRRLCYLPSSGPEACGVPSPR